MAAMGSLAVGQQACRPSTKQNKVFYYSGRGYIFVIMGTFLLAFGVVILIFYLSVYVWSKRRQFQIKGKHILITGGSSGIGKALAAEVLKHGASRVTLIARNVEKLKSTEEELKKKLLLDSQVVKIISADINKPNCVDIVLQILKDVPPVDIIVNSAGITHTGSFLDTGDEVFENMISTNVIGSIRITRAVLPSMMARKQGSVVFVSSQAGQFPVYGYTAYSASKFALRGIAEVLQMELKPFNIAVSVSFPPDTDTPQLEEEMKHRSDMVKLLLQSSSAFQPQQIAAEIANGIERQEFTISHGFEGFMLKTATAGASPGSLWDVLVQFWLMGLFRVVAAAYVYMFNGIIKKQLKKQI